MSTIYVRSLNWTDSNGNDHDEGWEDIEYICDECGDSCAHYSEEFDMELCSYCERELQNIEITILNENK